MASNLECEITEGSTQVPGMPTPWQVQMRWYDMVDDGTGELDRQLIRTWTTDAPSELVARTLLVAFNNVTDSELGTLTSQGYQV